IYGHAVGGGVAAIGRDLARLVALPQQRGGRTVRGRGRVDVAQVVGIVEKRRVSTVGHRGVSRDAVFEPTKHPQ
nr:hypothetical protein [Tanacetum cinerariifolium]